MSTDNYGNEIATHDLDLEYVYPPKSERICAQDERFAGVNEAIGLLEYKLEQHIAQDAATLADFISSSWAVLDEYGARIAALEDAQPIPQISRWPAAAHPPEGDWAHIPSSVWEDICEELEGLRAKWASVPWEAMALTLAGFMQMVEEFGHKLHPDDAKVIDVMLTHAISFAKWKCANAPKEAAE